MQEIRVYEQKRASFVAKEFFYLRNHCGDKKYLFPLGKLISSEKNNKITIQSNLQ